MVRETVEGSEGGGRRDVRPKLPGIVAVWSGTEPLLRAVPVGYSPLVLGRGDGPGGFDDARMSRRHAEISFAHGRFHVRDLGSRNGTSVDGSPASEGPLPEDARVVRVGDSLLSLRADVRPFMGATVRRDGDVILGPVLAAAHNEIASIARSSDVLCLHGETGVGKELAARAFHQTGRGPFVAVNCAAVPPNLAERILFGARKGAYSGADADVEGVIQSADGGTLFLDEIVELPADVQAKLLRVLETRQVTPLGGTQARTVKLRLCSAANAELRSAVAAGKFREDLYYRLGRPLVRIPPLRERREEIPWLIRADVPGPILPHVSLVEDALLRPWPGNVRELRREVADALRRAVDCGDTLARSSHLAEDAGLPLAGTGESPGELASATVETALRAASGNVTEAARRLNLHRNQLRRWLEKHGVDPTRFK